MACTLHLSSASLVLLATCSADGRWAGSGDSIQRTISSCVYRETTCQWCMQCTWLHSTIHSGKRQHNSAG